MDRHKKLIDLFKRSRCIVSEGGKMSMYFEDITAKVARRIMSDVLEVFCLKDEELVLNIKFEIPLEKVTLEDPHEREVCPKEHEECPEQSLEPLERSLKSEHLRESHTSKDGRLSYEIAEGILKITIRRKKYKFDYEKVKDLYEELPQFATVKEAMSVANKIGFDVSYGEMLVLFDFYAENVNFDAKLLRKGRLKILAKDEYSLHHEFLKKISLEKEVIGTPWGRD